jgi:hypothetical protein
MSGQDGDNSRRWRFEPHADFAKLQELFPAVRALQMLADKHGIDDIFQDNGGKILQLCLCLGISVLPGREGNDAVDQTTGGEFELKTLNIKKNGGWTTHHHLNPAIIAKYRQVDWIFAAYEGIELKAIWRLSPKQMEPMFQHWEAELARRGAGTHMNNPKIPRSFVFGAGAPIWTVAGPLEFTKPKRVQRRSFPVLPPVVIGNPPYSPKKRIR